MKKETITIFGSGNQTRDFFYVRDLADCIHYLLQNIEKISNVNNVFNLGYGNYISILDLVKK